MTKPKVAQASNLFLFPDLRFQVPKKVYLLIFTKMRSYFLLLFFQDEISGCLMPSENIQYIPFFPEGWEVSQVLLGHFVSPGLIH